MKEVFNLMSCHFKKKILALLHDVLNPSNFRFGGQSYIQTDRLSMGLLLSPVIADSHTEDSEFRKFHHFVYHMSLNLIYLTQAFSFHTSTVFTLTTHNTSISALIIQHYTLATHPLHECPSQCEGPWISCSLCRDEQASSMAKENDSLADLTSFSRCVLPEYGLHKLKHAVIRCKCTK